MDEFHSPIMPQRTVLGEDILLANVKISVQYEGPMLQLVQMKNFKERRTVSQIQLNERKRFSKKSSANHCATSPRKTLPPSGAGKYTIDII